MIPSVPRSLVALMVSGCGSVEGTEQPVAPTDPCQPIWGATPVASRGHAVCLANAAGLAAAGWCNAREIDDGMWEVSAFRTCERGYARGEAMRIARATGEVVGRLRFGIDAPCATGWDDPCNELGPTGLR